MPLAASSGPAASLAVSACSLAAAAYLFLRLRKVEAQLAAEVDAARAAHLHLTRRVEAAMETRTSAATAAAAPSSTAPPSASRSLPSPSNAAQTASEPTVRSRADSVCSSSHTGDLGDLDHGYKTADEDADDEEDVDVVSSSQPPPAAFLPGVTAASAATPVGGAVAGAPSAGDDWGARSVMAENGSWSCIDGHGGGGSGGASLAPTTGGSEAGRARAADEARLAAEGAVLAKADELYDRKEYEAAAALLAGSEQSVEVQWRRCRVLKELGEAAKQAGDADRCRTLLYEGLEHVTLALNLGEGGSENAYVHKWYAIAVSQTSTYEGTKVISGQRQEETNPARARAGLCPWPLAPGPLPLARRPPHPQLPWPAVACRATLPSVLTLPLDPPP